MLIVERDHAPPAIAPDAAFTAWERPGVAQFRSSHSLLARLQKLLRERYPEVLAELAAAGVEPCPIPFVLPTQQIASYEPQPSDIDLRHLLGRRATFEYVLRQHLARQPQVRFLHDTRVEGLRIVEDAGQLRVTGVNVVRGDAHETLDADLVVDASGSRSKCEQWLRDRGAAIESETHASEFAYFCRHYHIRDAGSQPFERRTGVALDHIWFGAFFAEHGHFSLALACPMAETEVLRGIKEPATFDLIGRSMPGVEELLDRAEPVSRVLGSGGLTNRWTQHVVKGKPSALGFFAVGDSQVHTNPMYGRGCTAAFVQAEALAEALAETREPLERARRYSEKVWRSLRPQYEFCVSAEQLFSGRGKRARGEAMAGSVKLADYFTDQIWAPTATESPFIARESVKTMQMQEPSGFWTRIAFVLYLLYAWALRGFRSVPLVAERSGPSRAELLQQLRDHARVSQPPSEADADQERDGKSLRAAQ